MSTFDLPNDISNSSVGSAQYVDASKLQANYVKIESEWQDGTNTDFNIASGEIASLNASASSSNTIGNISTTTMNAATMNVTTLNATNGSGLAPIGSITAYIGLGEDDETTDEIEPGWHVCDGRAVSRGDYANLYSLIGNRFGDGDGSTTFNLPDLRGYFLRGLDDGAGNDPDAASRTDAGDGTTGDAIGTKQDYAVKEHFHEHRHEVTGTYDDKTSGSQAFYDVSADYSSGAANNVYTSYEMDSADAGEVGVNDAAGTSIAATLSSTESRPKNIAVKYIIRAK